MSNHCKQISFIIPAHNEADTLPHCIQAIRRNDPSDDHEIIICISSTNSNNAYLWFSEDPQIRIIKSRGTSRAIQMNEGSVEAKGSILCFVHADVRLPLGAVEDIHHNLKLGFNAGYFSYRFDNTHPLLKINARLIRKDGVFAGGGDQSLFITRQAFDLLGGFDESKVIMEDFDLFDRMKKQGIPYTFVQNDSIVSARKYQKNSYLWVNLVNGITFLLYKLGTSPVKLKKIYKSLLK